MGEGEFWEWAGEAELGMKGRWPKEESVEGEGSQEVLCFVNTFQELVFVEDAENAKRVILEEICPGMSYGAPVSADNCKDFDSRLMTPV